MPRRGKKKKVFSAAKEIRAIARERVGRVKAAVEIVPKAERKPKHKPRYNEDSLPGA